MIPPIFQRITSPKISPFGGRATSTIAAGNRGISALVTLCECARPVAEPGGCCGPRAFVDDKEYELPFSISGMERVFLSFRGVLEPIVSIDPLVLVRVCWVVVALFSAGGMKVYTLMRERRFGLGACRCSGL